MITELTTYVLPILQSIIASRMDSSMNDWAKIENNSDEGKFNLIITKEISRFARDTLDSISYTRKLIEYGVGVFFQYDHINTFNSDSE